jgi:hypothetical protein
MSQMYKNQANAYGVGFIAIMCGIVALFMTGQKTPGMHSLDIKKLVGPNFLCDDDNHHFLCRFEPPQESTDAAQKKLQKAVKDEFQKK